MSTEINTLPEIFDTLFDAGFCVDIADSHELLYVTLSKRNVSVQEVMSAMHWDDIPSNVKLIRTPNGVIVEER